MTAKEKLYRLIDELPESDLPAAERMLKALRATIDPVMQALNNAPLDDERDDDDEDGGLTQARSEESITHEEARRRLLSQ